MRGLVIAAVMLTAATALPAATHTAGHKITKPARPVFSFLGVATEAVTATATVAGNTCSIKPVGTDSCAKPYATPINIGNAPIKILMLKFNNGKLSSVLGSTGSDFFPDLLAAFRAKYGAPAEIRKEKWESRAGGVFDNTVAIWNFKGRSLKLAEMGTQRDDTDFYFTSEANSPASKDVPVNF